ncbi:putative peptidoglycan D,D-transpeptidase PenA [Calidithermus terrae]|uniref:Putative peptidoglycan D,D-transpeptidase PenA n=1 Tax=Calidithermus terrae TaxID=1408545 RepID=A0A399F208_9DEIN|nr:penicillin-binding protein 2 [Calidithermus terrae]RIH90767.1 putative peptidoglycan D,D-transpeptidase PenA [Calidithermus terrae]
MTQASLHRVWVVIIAFACYFGAVAYGLVQLARHAPQLQPRDPQPKVRSVPRGTLLAHDGTPLVMSSTAGARLYPVGVSASQVLGFAERDPRGVAGRGLSGLERDLESALAAGRDVRLTLDPAVQSLAEQALWGAIESSKADWGTALVMETRTGRLLAVANGPRFDPQAPRPDPAADVSWRNHAFLVALEPGSTMKALTAAALLEQRKAGLGTVVDAPMHYRVAGWTINDVVSHPRKLTLAEVLKYSSNVGISKLAAGMDRRKLYATMEQLHFTDPRPMPGARLEQPKVRRPELWGPTEYVNATFGQGFLITPLHLVAAFNALANDGLYLPPQLVQGPVGEGERVFRPEVARDVRKALTDGVAPQAKLEGYAVGGKTGTAQVVVDGRYSRTVYNALFAGFIPSDEPRVTVVVVLHHPKGPRIHGSMVAAPVFREIAAGLFSLWGEPPRLEASPKSR